MTQKDILNIAKNPELMETLTKIAEIHNNMCHKTEYEQRTAIKKMKQYAKEITEAIKTNAE